jgi:cytochrome c oxidase subunit 2
VTSDFRDRRRNRRRRRALAAAIFLSGVLLAGCGKQSILQTHSPQAHNIALLWWWMLGAAVIVFFGALAMLVIGFFRRGTPGLPLFGEREEVNERMVLVFGIAIPAVVLVVLFGVSDVYLVGQTSPPNPQTTSMTIDVIGHQWWWEVRYPGSAAVTANEIHIPVRTPVRVEVRTADVIHSFWVPQLNRKIDAIPGRRNAVELDADAVGRYRGQCAEFCGLQHAHMGFSVVAESAGDFERWVTRNQQPAPEPTSDLVERGELVFTSSACAGCHTIDGTTAQGTRGPNLTHVGTRQTLGARTIPNTPSEMKRWIENPATFKPGVKMPPAELSNDQVEALVAYLQSRK